jgi:hypothetical protein
MKHSQSETDERRAARRNVGRGCISRNGPFSRVTPREEAHPRGGRGCPLDVARGEVASGGFGSASPPGTICSPARAAPRVSGRAPLGGHPLFAKSGVRSDALRLCGLVRLGQAQVRGRGASPPASTATLDSLPVLGRRESAEGSTRSLSSGRELGVTMPRSADVTLTLETCNAPLFGVKREGAPAGPGGPPLGALASLARTRRGRRRALRDLRLSRWAGGFALLFASTRRNSISGADGGARFMTFPRPAPPRRRGGLSLRARCAPGSGA